MLRGISISLLFIAVLPIWAVDIPIANAGFEQVVLPCAPGPNCFSAAVTGWTSNTIASTFKPATGPGGSFSTPVPEGVNVAALGAANATLGDGVLVQTLAATLQPNTTYTLVFSVGSRSDVVFAGYSVELLTGSTTVAADSSLSPPTGTFMTGRIVYSSSAVTPALLGQALGIRLTGNGRGQADFDKISLDATPASISSSVSQIASGGGWKTTLTLVNLSSAPNSVRVAFKGDDGNQLTLPLVITQQGNPQSASASSVDRTLGAGATLVIESEAPVSSPTQVGWAEVISSGSVSGFAIFRNAGQMAEIRKAPAPLESARSSSLLLPFDNTAGFVTGLALINPTASPVIVNATIRDENGAQIGLQAVALSAMGHTSFAVPSQFSTTSGRRGIIEFQNTAGGSIAGLGLRFGPSSFTSVPIIVR